jgi:hypothetical protein
VALGKQPRLNQLEKLSQTPEASGLGFDRLAFRSSLSARIAPSPLR